MTLRTLVVPLIVLALTAPAALASGGSDLSASVSCAPVPPGDACILVRAGTLSVVCDPQCNVVAQGYAAATDATPLKSVSTRMQVGGAGSASNGCIGLGTGTSKCPFNLVFPLFLPEGGCHHLQVTSTYDRTPFSPVSLTHAFSVCRTTGDEHTVTAA